LLDFNFFFVYKIAFTTTAAEADFSAYDASIKKNQWRRPSRAATMGLWKKLWKKNRKEDKKNLV